MGKAAVIALPYGWHILFFMVPFLIVLKLSFSDSVIGIPPYTPILEWVDGTFLQIKLNLANYNFLFEDEMYIEAYLESLTLAGIATVFCLLIGYPIAYGITRMNAPWRTILLMLIVLPFWTSFLIRVYAWVGILSNQGIINQFLLWVGVIQDPLLLMNNQFSVIIGIVYSYLPFMVLPLYSALEKVDPVYLEAASDLGCKPWRAFFKIIVPLSMRGVIGGAMLVFIPAVGEYVIPALLGGSDSNMIGKVLWSEFFTNNDWPLASSVAIAMLIFLVIPIIIFQKLLAVETDES